MLSASRLDQLGRFISLHLGLRFSDQRQGELQRGICSAAEEFGFSDADACIDWLTTSPEVSQRQIEILAGHLTIGETYFFRERGFFQVFEEQILPAWVAARRGRDRRLRIWSAGCCTGEEPYSVAIALLRGLPDLGDWDVTVLATDVNPRFLHKARDGLFGQWSFRDLSEEFKDRYFTRTKQGRYQILPQIRKMVRFDYLNLARDVYPALANGTNAMDLILCRNVLIYFEPEWIPDLVRKLCHSLVDEGWLMVGAAETPYATCDGLSPVHFPGAILFQKRPRPRPDNPPRPMDSAVPQAANSAPLVWPLPSSLATLPAGPPGALGSVAINAQHGAVSPTEPLPEPSALAEAARLYDEGCYAEVMENLRQGIARGTAGPEVFALAIHASANLGDMDEALRYCRQAISADKLNPGFHYLAATILQERGDLAEAAASLRRAIFLDPDFALAHFMLGLLASRRGKAEEERRHLDNALRTLRDWPAEKVLPWSEGITVARLAQTVTALRDKESA
jgi:chemotaxis protein methyltransferase CheR